MSTSIQYSMVMAVIWPLTKKANHIKPIVKKVNHSTRTLTLVLVMVVTYLILMDVALYIRLQKLLPLNQRPNSCLEGQCMPFLPNQPITIKVLMMAPSVQFINDPFCMWIEDTFTISDYFTANAISIIGLCFGLIAARLFMCSTSKKWHFLAFFFNILRDVADSLDGFVARARDMENIRTRNPGSSGFTIDAICDAIAQGSIIIATGFCLLSQVSSHGFLHLWRI